jgi:two-component system, response regulator PdtaR
MSKAKSSIKNNKTVGKESDKQLIHALAKISEAIVSDSYIEDVLKLIVTIIAENLGSKICSLMLVDTKTNELVLKATQSVSEEYNKKPNLKFGQGIAGQVAKTGEHISVYDIQKDERYLNREIALKENLKSLLSVPLMFKGHVIGVLNCYTEKLHKFTGSEIALVKTIANQAAVVIENFKLVVESQVIKEELESRKVIERAKGILMREENLSEEQAYGKIRKYSMDNRRSMREIAEAIVVRDDMSKNSKS